MDKGPIMLIVKEGLTVVFKMFTFKCITEKRQIQERISLLIC